MIPEVAEVFFAFIAILETEQLECIGRDVEVFLEIFQAQAIFNAHSIQVYVEPLNSAAHASWRNVAPLKRERQDFKLEHDIMNKMNDTHR